MTEAEIREDERRAIYRALCSVCAGKHEQYRTEPTYSKEPGMYYGLWLHEWVHKPTDATGTGTTCAASSLRKKLAGR